MAHSSAPNTRGRKAPPRLARRVDSELWEIVGATPGVPNRYCSRDVAIRAIDLTDDERWQVHAAAAARDHDKRVVTYGDVMWTLAARTESSG